MLYRPCDASLPLSGVGAITLGGTIGIGHLEDGTEGTLMAEHAFGAIRRDNLIGPPTGGDLRGEDILLTGFAVQGRGDVVGKGAAGLLRVGETGLQHFVANALAVDIEIEDTETGGHPTGTDNVLVVAEGADEPVGPFGRATVLALVDGTNDHGGIGRRDPLCDVPSGIIEGCGAGGEGRRGGAASGEEEGEEGEGEGEEGTERHGES